MNEHNEKLYNILKEIREGQKESLALREKALQIQEQQFNMAQKQIDKAERMQVRAETMQKSFGKLVKWAVPTLFICIIIIVVSVFKLPFRW